MAFYCGTMLAMALELARENPAYGGYGFEVLRAFRGHQPTPSTSQGGTGLWNEEDGFFYDQLAIDGRTIPLAHPFLVGLLPLIAVEVLEDNVIEQLPDQDAPRLVPEKPPDLADLICYMCTVERRGTCRHLLRHPFGTASQTHPQVPAG